MEELIEKVGLESLLNYLHDNYADEIMDTLSYTEKKLLVQDLTVNEVVEHLNPEEVFKEICWALDLEDIMSIANISNDDIMDYLDYDDIKERAKELFDREKELYPSRYYFHSLCDQFMLPYTYPKDAVLAKLAELWEDIK